MDQTGREGKTGRVTKPPLYFADFPGSLCELFPEVSWQTTVRKMTGCWAVAQLNRVEESDLDEGGWRWVHSSPELTGVERPTASSLADVCCEPGPGLNSPGASFLKMSSKADHRGRYEIPKTHCCAGQATMAVKVVQVFLAGISSTVRKEWKDGVSETGWARGDKSVSKD